MVTSSKTILFTLVGLTLAVPARSGGWEPVSWRGRAELLAVNNPYPGYVATRADGGVAAELEARTSRRLGGPLKIGLTAASGIFGYAHFSEARHLWARAGLWVRRGGTRLLGAFEVAPSRVKFPSTPLDAEFRREEWKAGLRQALPGGLRAAADFGWERDDYASGFDGRDARNRDLVAGLEWSPARDWTVAGEAIFTRSDAAADKYDYRDHGGGGCVARALANWRIEGRLRSGTRRYDAAAIGDSNYRRRDRWIETTLRWSRDLSPTLSLDLTGTIRDQVSSRQDRTYTLGSMRAGVTWALERGQ